MLFPDKKCPNCTGEHSASDKICPRFTKESVVLKIKHTQNLTYAGACKQYSKTQVGASTLAYNNSDFPPLPLNSSCSRKMDTALRPPVNLSYDHTTTNATLFAHHAGGENCPSGLMLGYPVLFLAYLADVINETIPAKEKNEPIDLFKIITDAAGDRTGLPVDARQLKALFSYMAIQVLQWNCRSIFRKFPEFKQLLSKFHTLPHIICLQETHLTQKYQPSLPGYTMLRKDRPPHLGKGGGLCIAVKTSSAYSEVAIVTHTAMEAMGISLNDLYLFNIWTWINPPGTNLDQQFFNQLTGNRKFVICGDFNSHHSMWGSLTSNAAGRFLFFIENHDFVVLNTSTLTTFLLPGQTCGAF